MQLSDATDLLIYWANNATTVEKVSLFFLTVTVLLITRKLVNLLDSFLEREVKKIEDGVEKSVPAAGQSASTKVKPRESKKDFENRTKSFWWKQYDDEQIVSLDCEWVTLKEPKSTMPVAERPLKKEDVASLFFPSKERKERVVHERAGTVAIWTYKGKKLYEGKVYHAPGSFKINVFQKAINGFSEDSFEDGKPFETIQEEVKNILKDKLVVVICGGKDFSSLGLNIAEYDVFDLQSVYYTTQENNRGAIVKHPHSLRSIFYHYFKKDIHKRVHTAAADAKATMLIFKHGYQQDCQKFADDNTPDGWPDGRNDIERLK